MARKDQKETKKARLEAERWFDHFRFNIDQYHNMFDFVLGRQWTDDESEVLIKTSGKVPLQFNKLATLVNSLLGEQQQNMPQIEVNPKSQCDEETASIRQLIVKDMMLSGKAKTVYQVAAMQAFVGGFGAYIVDTKYSHPRSFDLDIVYEHMKDATKAYWDISADNVDKTDGMYGGFVYKMSRQKFRSVYGNKVEKDISKDSKVFASKEEVAAATNAGGSTDPFSWADEEGITLMNRYVRKVEKSKLYKLSNGRVLDKEEMRELAERSIELTQSMYEDTITESIGVEDEMLPDGEEVEESAEVETDSIDDIDLESDIITLYDDGEPVRIEDTKETNVSKIMRYIIAGDYILEEEEFPSEDIPVIFVDQNSYYEKSGKQVCRPFVIDAVDAQRYVNYLGTQSAYILKISRYDQFIASKQNMRSNDTAKAWRDPQNVKGAIPYDETPSGAKPEQLRPPELSASLGQQYQRAIEDMYTSTGMYPTRLGQTGNEVSGAAIDARTRQGSYPTYVAFNSINRAITAGGRIINQMIPKVYDTERVINLMTPDQGRQNITINHQQDDYGEIIKNDLRKGTFEVELIAGASYEGQKEQALNSLNMVLQANPQLLNLFADLYAENLPLANTIEIKNRLKTIVPPEILQAGKTGEMPEKAQQPNPQDQAIMAEIQMKQEQIAIKKAELQLKIQESQAQTQQKEMEIEIRKLEAAAQLEEQQLRYLAETQRTRSDNAISHADNITKLLTSK